MRIVALTANDGAVIEQVARLLVAEFRELWPDAWPTLDDALREVGESFAEDRLSRVALDDDGTVLGWIGGIRQYDGHVWEVHPLVVAGELQGGGIGRALVEDLELRVREQGALTLWVGTDDESDQTSLAGADLYDDLPSKIATIRNLRRHPYEFYQRCGFAIVGVMPDANGSGKPDIYMAKRVAGSPSTTGATIDAMRAVRTPPR